MTSHLDKYLDDIDSKKSGDFAPYQKDTRLAKAYEVSLDIRKFEIELYWKRTGYFWLLIAAFATSLGVVLTAGSEQLLSIRAREIVALVISCAGAMMAISWTVVNRASKAWQRNWELQVDLLEDKVIGPLYKTVMFKGAGDRLPLSFSVSDANFWISIYFAVLFACSAAYFSGIGRYTGVDSIKAAVVVVNAIFLIILLGGSWTRRTAADLQVPLSYTRRTITPGKSIPEERENSSSER